MDMPGTLTYWVPRRRPRLCGVTQAPAEPSGRLGVESHSAPQLPLRLGFNSSSGKASGGGIWRGGTPRGG